MILEKINGWTIITDRLSNGELFKRRFMDCTKAECIGRFKTEKRLAEEAICKQ